MRTKEEVKQKLEHYEERRKECSFEYIKIYDALIKTLKWVLGEN